MKNNKGGLFTKIFAVVVFSLGCLLSLTITESLGRGEVNTFLVFLTVINGLCGIIGGILLFLSLEQGRILIKYQCLTGFLFVIFYASINNEWINPTILLSVIFLAVFFFTRVAFVRESITNRELYKENRGNLKFNSTIKIFFTVLISFSVLIWVVKWEEYLGIFHSPNGEGISFYSNPSVSSNLQISIDGGYVYDTSFASSKDSLNQLTVVMDSPDMSMQVDSYKDLELRFNFFNVFDGSKIFVNGQEIEFNNQKRSKLWDGTENEIVSYIQNHSYSLFDNGTWFDLVLQEGNKYDIDVKQEELSEKALVTDIFIMSDLHSGYLTYVPELKNVEQQKPDFLVLNGDIVNWGYPTEYMIMSLLTKNLSFPIYTTVGNHDIWNDGKDSYNKYFGPDYYSFEYNGNYFIFLDTSRGIVGNTQMQWLERELEYSKDMKVVLFSHMSPVNTVLGSYDSSELVSEEFSSTIFSRAESDHLLKLMDLYDVDAFVSGHSHVMGRVLLNDTLYISSGALGGSVNSGHTVGYLRCLIDEEGVYFSDIVVKPEDIVATNTVLNSLNTARVFGIPFLINKSLRIACTILVLIIGEVVWFSIVVRRKKG